MEVPTIVAANEGSYVFNAIGVATAAAFGLTVSVGDGVTQAHATTIGTGLSIPFPRLRFRIHWLLI